MFNSPLLFILAYCFLRFWTSIMNIIISLSHSGGGGGAWDNVRPVVAGWRPQGLLVAHLHEHRGAVNRVRVSADQSQFATCSNDGTVKVWDCERLEGRSITNRSRYTYNKQGGQIKVGSGVAYRWWGGV